MTEIAASVLNADLSKWKEWLPQLEKARVGRIQFDIMDNRFVPNTGVPRDAVRELRPHTKIFFESHLMVENPEEHVREFAEMGNQLLIFHAEAAPKPKSIIHLIRDSGQKAGIAINNMTPVEKIYPHLHEIDLALVMSVDAGFGGQKFNPAALGKISELRRKIDAEGLACEIEVDGGINAQTAGKCVKAGTDILAAGTFIFGHKKGIGQAVRELRGHDFACSQPLKP